MKQRGEDGADFNWRVHFTHRDFLSLKPQIPLSSKLPSLITDELLQIVKARLHWPKENSERNPGMIFLSLIDKKVKRSFGHS